MPNKVTQEEMLGCLDRVFLIAAQERFHLMPENYGIIHYAIRALIIAVGEWIPLANEIMSEDDMREVCSDKVCILARKIRDFGEGGRR